jgi:hypothetical protein
MKPSMLLRVQCQVTCVHAVLYRQYTNLTTKTCLLVQFIMQRHRTALQEFMMLKLEVFYWICLQRLLQLQKLNLLGLH